MIVDENVFITGRLKDLIIVAGRNHYPQDIEATAEEATKQIAPGVLAAFSISTDDVEGLVIIAERDPEADESGDAQAIDAVRAAVTKKHGVQPADVRIIGVGEIPRSSAHKIARRVAAKAYKEGCLLYTSDAADE